MASYVDYIKRELSNGKVKCPCGTMIKKESELDKHIKSDKHLNWVKCHTTCSLCNDIIHRKRYEEHYMYHLRLNRGGTLASNDKEVMELLSCQFRSLTGEKGGVKTLLQLINSKTVAVQKNSTRIMGYIFLRLPDSVKLV